MRTTLEAADLNERTLTAGEFRRMIRYAIGLFAVALLVTPVASVQLTASEGLYAMLLAAAMTAMAITALVLFVRSRARRSRPMMVLALGFVYATLTLLPYALLYPGMVPGLAAAIGAGATATSYLWSLWQIGLLVSLLAYQWLRMAERTEPAGSARGMRVIIALVAMYVVLTPAAIWLALPPTAQTAGFTPAFFTFIAPVISLMAAATIVETFRSRSRVNLVDAWIAVVAFGVLIEIYLAVVGQTRFTIGWYVGRVVLLAATSGMLAVLLLQAARVYTELIARAAVLEGEAHTDTLTGLPNRRRFDEEFARAFGSAIRRSSPLGIAIIDIDRFKDYNDAFGHQAGDDALRRIAEAIAESVERSGDFAARYGGEEFVVILEDTTLGGAAGVAERIRNAVLDARIPAPGGGVLSVSVGVAARLPGSSGEALLGQADAALYAAKNAGRNRVATWRSREGAPIGSAYDEPFGV